MKTGEEKCLILMAHPMDITDKEKMLDGKRRVFLGVQKDIQPTEVVWGRAPRHCCRSNENSFPLQKVRVFIHVRVLVFESFGVGRDALIQEIRNNDVTIILGETGSGKTTRASLTYLRSTILCLCCLVEVPQYLLESGIAGCGMVAVTQPRRVAATSLAARVALERNSNVGNVVGYSIRFDERSSAGTRIKYMTDGMIVRELLSDPLLSNYSVVVVDEAHERTLRTDLLMANLKTILKERNGTGDVNDKGKGKADRDNPIKVVIMSATLDAEKFSRFFYKWVFLISLLSWACC
jgi:DEAD/DEAH box helicase